MARFKIHGVEIEQFEVKDVPGFLLIRSENYGRATDLAENLRYSGDKPKFKHFKGDILCLNTDDSIEQITEKQMNDLGYERKAKND